MGHALDTILPIAAAVIGTALGQPEAALAFLGPAGAGAAGAGLASGGLNYSKTHNIGSALKSGALSGAGSFIGGNIGDSLFPAGAAGSGAGGYASGTLGSGINSALGGDLGSYVGDAAGSVGAGNLLGTSLGQVAGSYAGSNLADSFAPQGQGSRAGTYPYIPTQAAAAAAPKGISGMGNLTPIQQASGLATQGLYGGGLGSDEQSYYGNLINRQLVDSGGHVSPLSSLSPIEQSYNSKLGFGGQTDSNSLLKALSQWNPSA